MLFATYQPGSMIEALAAGEIKPYTIWAVPAENLEELFLSLFCCAPNRMEALIFFSCDNYIRLDKIKWYQAVKEHNHDRTLNPQDYASDEVDNLHSEFLVETIVPEQIEMLVPIFNVGEAADILERGSLKLEGAPAEFMRMQAKNICTELNFSVQENIQLGMSENYATYRSEFQPKKMAFELIYLPMAYNLLTAAPGQFTVNVAHMVYMFSYHARDYYRLNNDFTRWSLSDCSVQGFDEIMERMRHYILDNAEVAERIVRGIPIGRNDPCPCGSGKKYKKCHGMWA